MKKLIAIIVGWMLLSSPVFAKDLLECRSIDRTYRPFYNVMVSDSDSYGNPYNIRVERVTELGEIEPQVFHYSARGFLENDRFEFDLGTDWDGLLVKIGKLYGTRLSNGVLVGKMNFLDDATAELACRLR